MSRILPMIEHLMMMGAIGNQMPARKQDRTSQTIFGFSAILGIVSMMYLVVALSYWLKSNYSPDVAALATSGIILSFALLVAALGYTYNVIRKSKIDAVADEMKARAMTAISALSEELEDPIRHYPKSSLAIASLAGYVLGNKL